MTINLFRAASEFLKLSQQDISAQLTDAVNNALDSKFPGVKMDRGVAVILATKEVKVNVNAEDLTKQNGSRGEVEQLLLPVVQKLAPDFKLTVIASISSEGKTATLRKNFSRFHKLSQQAPVSRPDPALLAIQEMISPYGGIVSNNKITRDVDSKRLLVDLQETRTNSKLPAQTHTWLTSELHKLNLVPADWTVAGVVTRKQ